MTASRATRIAFVAMIREEWRLHAQLFGGWRFAAMPLLIAAITASGGWLLSLVGTPSETVLAGAHALVFVFGLHVGTIGLVGHDSLESLLGDVTLLLSSSRTLPLSPRRLLGIFLLKDVVYYAVLVLAPAVLGLAAASAIEPEQAAVAFVTVTATMALGFAVVFAGIALRTRGRTGTLALVGTGTVGVAAWWRFGVTPIAFTPYALLGTETTSVGGSAVDAIRSLGPTVLLVAVGTRLYDPTHQSPTRTRPATFDAWRRRFGDESGLVTKTLFDVARSGGGLVKVPFSAGIILAVAIGTVEFAGVLTGRPPATGTTLGALLGLTAFTTYNWLTQFDDPGSYLIYPVSVGAVLAAKYRAFLVLGLPVGLGTYVLVAAWYRPPIVDAVAGAALVLGLQGYLFGVTVYLAGLQPEELLFDTVLFAGFTLAVAVALVPVLIAGLALAPLTDPSVGGVLVAAGVGLGGAGAVLASRARDRWTRRYRTNN